MDNAKVKTGGDGSCARLASRHPGRRLLLLPDMSMKFGKYLVAAIILIALLVGNPVGMRGQDLSSLMAAGDAAWEKRGTEADPDNVKALDLFREATTLSPFSYEAHWKAARSLWWIADQALDSSPKKELQRDLGREGMEFAGRAVLIRPDGVEGHLYWALTALHYIYGIGTINALKEGVQDEVLTHLMSAYKQDKTYERGSAARELSVFYRTAPWPLRDKGKTLAFSREALALDPSGLRTAVFCAAGLEAAGLHGDAMELLKTAAGLEGDKLIEPDYKRWKRFAEKCLGEGRVIDPDMLF